MTFVTRLSSFLQTLRLMLCTACSVMLGPSRSSPALSLPSARSPKPPTQPAQSTRAAPACTRARRLHGLTTVTAWLWLRDSADCDSIVELCLKPAARGSAHTCGTAVRVSDCAGGTLALLFGQRHRRHRHSAPARGPALRLVLLLDCCCSWISSETERCLASHASQPQRVVPHWPPPAGQAAPSPQPPAFCVGAAGAPEGSHPPAARTRARKRDRCCPGGVAAACPPTLSTALR